MHEFEDERIICWDGLHPGEGKAGNHPGGVIAPETPAYRIRSVKRTAYFVVVFFWAE